MNSLDNFFNCLINEDYSKAKQLLKHTVKEKIKERVQKKVKEMRGGEACPLNSPDKSFKKMGEGKTLFLHLQKSQKEKEEKESGDKKFKKVQTRGRDDKMGYDKKGSSKIGEGKTLFLHLQKSQKEKEEKEEKESGDKKFKKVQTRGRDDKMGYDKKGRR